MYSKNSQTKDSERKLKCDAMEWDGERMVGAPWQATLKMVRVARTVAVHARTYKRLLRVRTGTSSLPRTSTPVVDLRDFAHASPP